MGLFRKKKNNDKKEIVEEMQKTENTTINNNANTMPSTDLKQTPTTTSSEVKEEVKTNTPVENNTLENKSAVDALPNELPNVKEIEVLDLNEKPKQKFNAKDKDFKFIILIFLVVILFSFSMPTIRNLLVPSASFKITPKPNEANVESGNLEHGYLVINKDSFKKIENIKFYEFKKYENDMIVFNYISDKNISKVSKLNIFIEIFDSNGILIHKELFDVSSKIKKEASSSFSMSLSDITYKAAYYAKVEVLDKPDYSKTLVCTVENKNADVKTTTKINYNFVDNMLKSYEYRQSFTMFDLTGDPKGYTTKYMEQYNLLKQTNIKDADIEYGTDTIFYKIDFSYFDLGDLEFKTRYGENDYFDYILKLEKKKGWKCE